MSKYGFNLVVISGNVGSDPVIRSNDEKVVVSFRMATNTMGKKNEETGEREVVTQWHNCVVFGKLADFAGQYVKKGTSILVEGRIQTSSWDDKEGIKQRMKEIVVEELLLIGSSKFGMNEITLCGNVGGEVDVRYTTSGVAVAKFSLAVNAPGKRLSATEREQKVEWNNMVMFGKQAETAEQYVKKGMSLLIRGELDHRSWPDKETGKTRYQTDVIVSNFLMLKAYEHKGEGAAGESDESPAQAEAPAEADTDQGAPNRNFLDEFDDAAVSA